MPGPSSETQLVDQAVALIELLLRLEYTIEATSTTRAAAATV
jgi:hypothetical protein